MHCSGNVGCGAELPAPLLRVVELHASHEVCVGHAGYAPPSIREACGVPPTVLEGFDQGGRISNVVLEVASDPYQIVGLDETSTATTGQGRGRAGGIDDKARGKVLTGGKCQSPLVAHPLGVADSRVEHESGALAVSRL